MKLFIKFHDSSSLELNPNYSNYRKKIAPLKTTFLLFVFLQAKPKSVMGSRNTLKAKCRRNPEYGKTDGICDGIID